LVDSKENVVNERFIYLEDLTEEDIKGSWNRDRRLPDAVVSFNNKDKK